MNVNQLLEGGFALLTATRAWRLHSDPSNNYDAFQYRFKVSEDFEKFKLGVRARDRRYKKAFDDFMTLRRRGIEDMKEFVAVCYIDTDKPLTPSAAMVADYFLWQEEQRTPAFPLSGEDFKIVDGIPRIMSDCSLIELHRRVRSLTEQDAWTVLKALQPQCDFMFDVKWWKFYRHAGLYQKGTL